MPDRPLRLGDVVDDYCPRCRLLLNHDIASLAETVNQTSKEVPHADSEIELAGLKTVPSVKVRPPRVAASPVAMECVVRQIIPCGTGPIAANLVIGEVVILHVADEVLDGKGGVDPRKLLLGGVPFQADGVRLDLG